MNDINIYLLSNENIIKNKESILKDFSEAVNAAGEYKREKDRLHFIGKQILLNRVLKLSEKDIKKGPNGKPYSDKTEKFFSFSDSGEYVLLAVADKNIGADIEIINEKHIKASKYAFTENEIAELKDNTTENFFKIWTAKESLSKAEGSGLGIGFKNIDVLPLIRGNEFIFGGKKYFGKSLAIPDYIISVCCEGKIGNVTLEYV